MLDSRAPLIQVTHYESQHCYLIYACSPLSEDQYRPFWVAWDGGVVRVDSGCEIDINTFLSYNDPTPLEVNNIGFGTCCGATAYWDLGRGKFSI